MNRIMIAGTKSGVGKTTISMGLMAALSIKMDVQPYKVGPDYIDSAFHSYITGNSCSNLDSYMLDREVIKYLFNKNSVGKDISIFEGVMGLFDGAEVGNDIGTSASIAKILDIPVILVVDGSKVASSLAATVKGFEIFDPELKITGVIINNVGSKKHYELLKSAIEYYTDVIPCGYLLKNSDLTMPERHLGLVPAGELEDIKDIFDKLAVKIEESIDLDLILKLSHCGEKVEFNKGLFDKYRSSGTKLRIGLAKDSAFNFYYKDSLDLMSELFNIEWIFYSPINDRSLPDNIDGLYLGGGFPEVFAKEISENISMNKSLLTSLNRGLPYIAECGGLMYLCDELTTLDGKKFNMMGWLKGDSIMTKRLQRFGYAELTYNDKKIKVHEFHRSTSNVEEKSVYNLKKIRSGEVISEWECGYEKKGGIAAYAHFHFAGNMEFAKQFADKCIEYKTGVKSGLH